MSVEVRVPEFGESVIEATVGRWLKREGEQVAAGDGLVELETEKVNQVIPADEAGVVERILKPEGETVHPGDVLAVIAPAGAAAAAPRAEAPATPQPSPSASKAPAAQPAEAPSPEWRPASPAVRQLAAEHDLDLSKVEGTGLGGRITVEDVGRYLDTDRQTAAPAVAQPPAPSPAPPSPSTAPAQPTQPVPETADRRETRTRLSRRRQTIARRLVEAQRTTASLTTFNEVDLGAIQDLRRRRNEEFQKRHGVRLGYMSFFTKAVVGALKAFPEVNSELQGDELILKHFYDVGIAVASPGGLVVPVVRDADRKGFAEIEREIADLATKAREGKLSLADLEGGTFTITNGGVFGSLLSTPILNLPQVGILGMHKVQERPAVVGGQIVARPLMYLALTYDHRVVDGQQAVQFLVRIKELIEDPETLLLEG